MRRALALLLAVILLFSLCACGDKETRAFRPLHTVGQRDYTVVHRAGDSLAPVVEAAVSVLAANGTLTAISWQWLNADLVSLEGDPEALAPYTQALEPRSVIVGVDNHFNPLSYDENGQMTGLFVDVAKAIGSLLGWEIKFQPIPRNELGAQLSSGNIDCAVGFDARLVSADSYSVGEGFLRSDIVLAVRSGSEIKSVKDIDGRRVGIVDDTAIERLLRSDEKLSKYSSGSTTYVSARQCVKAMDMGWCRAVVMDNIMLSYYEYN